MARSTIGESLDDWEALRWRERERSDLPKTMYKGLILCLMVREVGCLDCGHDQPRGQAASGQVPTRACGRSGHQDGKDSI